MENVKWLLEPDVFDEEQPIIDALDRLGLEYETVKFGKPYEDYLKAFKDDDCVVFHGSFQFGKLIQEKTKWFPGVFGNLPKFECSYYYPRLDGLLNSDYIMIPFGELNRFRHRLIEMFGERFFVRPSNCYKTFTGQVVSKETWDKDLELIGFYKTAPEDIIIIAPEVKIAFEWRFLIIGDGDILTGSQYKSEDREQPTKEAWYFAQSIVDEADYDPDSVWVLDVCQTVDGDIKIVEAGPFSCCALYNCDPEIVATEVSRQAWKDYEAYREKNGR